MAENYREPKIVFDGWVAPEGTGIIVTGSASGIGAATAILAAQSGLKVAAWDIVEDGIQETINRAGEFGKNIFPVGADLSSEKSIKLAMEKTLTFCKPLYLANVAGPKMLNTKWEFDEVISIALGMIRKVSVAFQETNPGEGSAIVNVAALAGVWEAGGGDPWYASAKSAIAGYTRHQAVELKASPRVNCVCPGGPIHTPRNHGAMDGEFMNHLISINPTSRAGRPEEEAAVIMFLLSPASSYVNGVVIPVDGGLHLAR